MEAGPQAGDVLRRLVAETDFLLARAQVELQHLEDQVRTLQAERHGLQLALARRQVEGTANRSPPAGPGAGTQSRGSWTDLSRAEAVLHVLVEEGRPLGRLEISHRLRESGRIGDDPDAVSAALAYLRRTGRAARRGSGQWGAVSSSPPGTGPSSASGASPPG